MGWNHNQEMELVDVVCILQVVVTRGCVATVGRRLGGLPVDGGQEHVLAANPCTQRG